MPTEPLVQKQSVATSAPAADVVPVAHLKQDDERERGNRDTAYWVCVADVLPAPHLRVERIKHAHTRYA